MVADELHEVVRRLLEVDQRWGGAEAARVARPVVRTAYEGLAGAAVGRGAGAGAERGAAEHGESAAAERSAGAAAERRASAAAERGESAAAERGVGRDLQAGLGELLEVYGWFLHDAGHAAAAERASWRALGLLRRAGHRSLELLTVQNLALQALTSGRPERVLELVRPVLDGASGLVSALFLAREAQALALMGLRREATRAFARAESRYLDGASGSDPEWAGWVDPRQFAIFEATMWSGLGEDERAARIFAETLETATGARSRYSLSGYLLASLVRAGDLRSAVELVPEIVPQVSGFAVSRDSEVLLRAASRMGSNDAGKHLQEVLWSGRGNSGGVLGGSCVQGRGER
ncbi:hypothetical protein [Kribbella sp. NPDC051770]|uniref:hypothetical protein n=1 Tax=Kribbella sp. NPDC051770 TaxID=3155413 RepID=UPI00341A9C00